MNCCMLQNFASTVNLSVKKITMECSFFMITFRLHSTGKIYQTSYETNLGDEISAFFKNVVVYICTYIMVKKYRRLTISNLTILIEWQSFLSLDLAEIL